MANPNNTDVYVPHTEDTEYKKKWFFELWVPVEKKTLHYKKMYTNIKCNESQVTGSAVKWV